MLHCHIVFSAKKERKRGSGVRFAEFLRHLVSPGAPPDPHWRSVAHLCRPCTARYKYIAHLETIDADSKVILRKIYGKDRAFPKQRLGPMSTGSTRNNSNMVVQKYYSTIDEALLESVRQEYSTDFELFGYT